MKYFLLIVSIAFLSSCTNAIISTEESFVSVDEIIDDTVTYIHSSYLFVPYDYLAMESDGIIIGTVKSVQEYLLVYGESDLLSMVINNINIQVERVISGDYKVGDIIKTGETGNGRTFICSITLNTGGYLQLGDKVLLIMKEIPDHSEEFLKNNGLEYLLPMYGFHPYQGRIWLTADGEIDAERNAYRSSPIKQSQTETVSSVSENERAISAVSAFDNALTEQTETLEEFIGRIEAVLTDGVAQVEDDLVGE
jgi:hypothetical protein